MPSLVLVAACVLALALAFAVARFGAGAAVDIGAFVAVNRLRLPFFIELAVRQVSHLGLLPTNALIWAAFWWRRSDRGSLFSAELLAGGLMLAAWSTCKGLKLIVPRVRPYAAVEGARLVGLESSGSSFPSSHAALSVFTALTVVQLYGLDGWRAFAIYALAAVVCFARMYFGAHYPSDVLAGVAIGLGWATVYRWVSGAL